MKHSTGIATALITLALAGGAAVAAWVVWGLHGLIVLVGLYAFLLAGICLWEYRRRGRWEYIVSAAGSILYAVAFSNFRRLEEDVVLSDVLVLSALFAGLGCLCVGAIATLRRKLREKAAPTLRAQNH